MKKIFGFMLPLMLSNELYPKIRDQLEEGRAFLIEAVLKKEEDESIRIQLNSMMPLDLAQGKSDLILPITSDKNLKRLIQMIQNLPVGNDSIVFRISTQGYPTVSIRLLKGMDISPQMRSQLLSLVVI